MYLLHHTVNDYALVGQYECQCDLTQRPTLSLLVYYYTKSILLVGIQPRHSNYIFTITVNI
jgi:hypothetical protein